MIGLFGLVLRWTFSRDRRATEPWPAPPPAASATGSGSSSGSSADFGLLAPVAVVDTADEAAQVRELLSAAGIRSTENVDEDGRHRVLVFSTELDRARRVSGWSP
jgi:hypothetical protein